MDNDITLTGTLVVAVTTLSGLISWVGRMLWVKLFDSKEGLIIILINRHIRFVDESSELLQINTDSQQTISMAMREISTAVKRTAEAAEHQDKANERIARTIEHQQEELLAFSRRFPTTDQFSTVQTNEAIHHLARAGRAHLDGKDDDCRRELDQAEKVVNGKT